MRISDWSSDVCSSDLASSPIRQAGAAEWSGAEGKGIGRSSAAHASPSSKEGCAFERYRFGHVTFSPYMVGTGTPAAERIVKCSEAFPSLPEPCFLRPRRSWPARPRARRRSEEHTSELQSLMRISYAVFCL